MNKIYFYPQPKCPTCKKPSKCLDLNNIKYKLIDIVKDPPSKNSLELSLIQFSSNKKIFNTRGINFKSIYFDIENLSIEKIIGLLSNDGELIKRSFLKINESKLIL